MSGLSLLRCGAASVSQPFLGVSAGCAFFPCDGQTLDQLIAVADRDMYRNKDSGKM